MQKKHKPNSVFRSQWENSKRKHMHKLPQLHVQFLHLHVVIMKHLACDTHPKKHNCPMKTFQKWSLHDLHQCSSQTTSANKGFPTTLVPVAPGWLGLCCGWSWRNALWFGAAWRPGEERHVCWQRLENGSAALLDHLHRSSLNTTTQKLGILPFSLKFKTHTQKFRTRWADIGRRPARKGTTMAKIAVIPLVRLRVALDVRNELKSVAADQWVGWLWMRDPVGCGPSFGEPHLINGNFKHPKKPAMKPDKNTLRIEGAWVWGAEIANVHKRGRTIWRWYTQKMSKDHYFNRGFRELALANWYPCTHT